MRLGSRSRVLSIFSYSLNARVLRAHADGPKSTVDLEATIGWAPQTSLRAAVTNLCDLAVLARPEDNQPSRGSTTRLTLAGRELLAVADHLEQWLLRSPAGPIALDGAAAAGAIRALTAGWDSGVIGVLAGRRLTLTELAAEIPDVSYPAIERRLARLRSAGLVTPVERRGRAKPYMVSDWLRRAIAPLISSCRWEQKHMGGELGPRSRVEVEAAFMLTLPLVELPRDRSGACTIGVLASAANSDEGEEIAKVTVEVLEGGIVSYVSGATPRSDTWALGVPEAWLGAVIDGRLGGLRVNGADPRLALELVRGIHKALFRPLG